MAKRPKKKKPEQPSVNEIQAIQLYRPRDKMVHVPRKHIYNGFTRKRMKRFLKAYEESFGNISAAARASGIKRNGFYRWMRGTSRSALWFQKKFRRIEPDEALVDSLEESLVQVATGPESGLLTGPP
jgi:hypothetical protein